MTVMMLTSCLLMIGSPVGALLTQSALSITSTTGVFGTPLALTTSGGSGTGAITFSATNGTALGCSVSVSTLSSSSAGTCVITASKASDGTYASTNSVPTTVTLSPATASILLSASPASPQNAGTTVTLMATLAPVNSTDPSGTVNFEAGGTSIPGCATQTLSAGVATCSIGALSAGTTVYTAVYSGDPNFVSLSSTPLNFYGVPVPSPPTGVLASMSVGGALVTWNAATPNGGFAVLGYTATASPGGGSCTVAAPGLACTIPGLTAGAAETITVTARSAGGMSSPSIGASLSVPALSSTSTGLTATALSPQDSGSPVTFVASVTFGASGTIEFENGGSAIPGCMARQISSGVATCTTSTLPTGTNVVTAVYSGDGSFAGSTSPALNFTIAAAALITPTAPLIVTSTSGPYNSSLALTTSGGSGTGAITFTASNGTNTGCSVSGSTLTFMSSGTCFVTATQASDGTYLAQSSNVTMITLFSSYPAVWAPISGYYYCPSGGTLSGSTCTSSTSATVSGYTCPSGGTLSGTTCSYYTSTYSITTITQEQNCQYPGGEINGVWYCGGYVTYSATPTYSCSTGTLSGSSCISSYSANIAYTYGYTCPYGGSQTNQNCDLSLAGGTAPGPPTSVVADSTSGAVTVTWIAPAASGGTSISLYTVTAIDSTTPTNGSETCTSNLATSCKVTGLTNGDSYTFTVVAANAQGSSVASSASNAVIPSGTPGAPTSVTASAGVGEALVSWTAPASDGGSVITSYTVTSSPGGLSCSTTGATLCTLQGLTNGTAYSFSVVASNVNGVSPSSGSSSPVTPTGPPGPPTSVTASAGNAQAVVSWSAPTSNGGSTITGYTVTSSPGAFTCTTTGATSCTVTGLTNGTSYTFEVTATTSMSTSPPSSASLAIYPGVVPDAPNSVVAAVNENQSSLVTWSAPTSNGGAPITGYTVTSSPGGFTCTTTGATSCTVTGLTNGVIYEFTVVAVNDVGTGPVTWNGIPITVSTTPSAPTGATATSSISGQATVTWQAPVSNGGAPVMGYSVTATDATHSANGGQVCTLDLTPTLIWLQGGEGYVAIDGNTAYVTNTGANSVSVVNLVNDSVTSTIAVGSSPAGIAVNPAGTQVWVANELDNSVSIISTSTNTVIATLTSGIGQWPVQITFNSAGTEAFVAEANGPLNANQITIVNTSTYATTPIPMGWYAADAWVNAAGTDLYVSSGYGLNVVNLSTFADTIIGGGAYPTKIVVNSAGTFAYGVNYSDDTVSVWNLSTLALTATISLPATYGMGPVDIVIDPTGSYAYVTNMDASTVTRIDLATNTAETNSTMEAWVYPEGIAINAAGTYLYTKDGGSAAFSIIPINPPLMCTFTGLTSGDTYTFSVTANNYSGSGPVSAASNSVTP